MSCRARVFGGVPVRRVVAAQRDAALLAGAQVDPLRADLDALLAFMVLGELHCRNGGKVSAGGRGHGRIMAHLRFTYFATPPPDRYARRATPGRPSQSRRSSPAQR